MDNALKEVAKSSLRAAAALCVLAVVCAYAWSLLPPPVKAQAGSAPTITDTTSSWTTLNVLQASGAFEGYWAFPQTAPLYSRIIAHWRPATDTVCVEVEHGLACVTLDFIKTYGRLEKR